LNKILLTVDTGRLEDRTGLFLGLDTRPVSVLSEPDTLDGCSVRKYFVRVSKDELYGDSPRPPMWLNKELAWGPHQWPVQWEDVLNMKFVDCGVFAAISTEVSSALGLRAHPLQMLIKFNKWNVLGWKGLWKNAGFEANWCEGDIAYHEGTLVVDKNGKGQLFDPQGPFYHNLHECPGYESPVAFRFFSDKEVEVPIGGILARPHQWYVIRDF